MPFCHECNKTGLLRTEVWFRDDPVKGTTAVLCKECFDKGAPEPEKKVIVQESTGTGFACGVYLTPTAMNAEVRYGGISVQAHVPFEDIKHLVGQG